MDVPEIIFIVPYRDREAYKTMFLNHMPYILEDTQHYEIYFSHQDDKRPFNRGAMKNLGFIHIKNKYPNDYKNMTFVFNDIDTLPGIKNLWDYKTTIGVIKHFYGYKNALGGIFSITGADFEKVNGFPNYWGWGFEDNCLQNRCNKMNISIDRNIFYKLGDMNILQFFNGFERTLDSHVTNKLSNDNGTNGLSSINKIEQNINKINEKYYMINFISWEIPENYKNIRFETKTNINKDNNNIFQRKIDLMDIMG